MGCSAGLAAGRSLSVGRRGEVTAHGDDLAALRLDRGACGSGVAASAGEYAARSRASRRIGSGLAASDASPRARGSTVAVERACFTAVGGDFAVYGSDGEVPGLEPQGSRPSLRVPGGEQGAGGALNARVYVSLEVSWSGQEGFGSAQKAFGSGQEAFGSGQEGFGSSQEGFGSSQEGF